MKIIPEVGKYYWVRFYQDDAEWEPAHLYHISEAGLGHWMRFDSHDPWYDTEINQIGPEIIPPADDWEVVE